MRSLFVGLMLVWLTAGCKAETAETVTPSDFHAVKFPKDFLWGVAEAAWQVEGDYAADGVTPSTNWAIWTRDLDGAKGETNPEGSGFYRLYEEDLDRAQSLGTNAFRMGIEWARIEPINDQWNEAAIQHYVKVIKAARKRGMRPMITFWHWVVPDWISDPRLPRTDPGRDQLAVPHNQWLYEEFNEFVAKMMPYIKDDVDFYSVLNEPWSVIAGGYVAGIHPPGETFNLKAAMDVHANLIFMQALAGKVIHDLDDGDADGDGKPALVGQAKATSVILPLDNNNKMDVDGAKNYNQIFNATDIDALTSGNLDQNGDGDTNDKDTVPPEGFYPELKGSLDWIGVQYYGPIFVKGFRGDPPFNALPVLLGLFGGESIYPNTEFGSQIRPAVYLATMEYFWNRYKLPIYLTENGTADCNEDQRPRHIIEHLYAVGRALDTATGAGIDVRGYFHWSLTDNFEWAEGTEQCFGLYGVNYKTFERTKRAGADMYAEVIKAGGIDAALYKKAFDTGYGGKPSISMRDTWAEIEGEIANGAAETLKYLP